jgi:hypothetical protein
MSNPVSHLYLSFCIFALGGRSAYASHAGSMVDSSKRLMLEAAALFSCHGAPASLAVPHAPGQSRRIALPAASGAGVHVVDLR